MSLVTLLLGGSLVETWVEVGSSTTGVDVLSDTVNEAVPLSLGESPVDGPGLDEVADHDVLGNTLSEELVVVTIIPELVLDALFDDDAGGSVAVTYTVVGMYTVVVKEAEHSALFGPRAAAPTTSPPMTMIGTDGAHAETRRIFV
ncbi:hypothetical protein PG993_002010 [Apiospora rasikravindrae]|uniref:Secreted protein n=1 Tax=Apiospora rasikravindrae TaxID=990691 RepID=A0ABR1UD07_9PEZI